MELEKNQALFTSLAQLRATTPFRDITISQLTANAQVSRMYFYRNFATYQAIIDQHIQALFQQFLRKVKKQTPTTIAATATLFFQCLVADAPAFKIFLAHDESNQIQTDFEQGLHQLIQLGVITAPDDPYWRAFTAGGLSRMLTLWLAHDTPESATVMGHKVAQIVQLPS